MNAGIESTTRKTNEMVGLTISNYFSLLRKKKDLRDLHHRFAQAFIFSRSSFLKNSSNRDPALFAKQTVTPAVEQAYNNLLAAIQEKLDGRLTPKLT